MKKLYDVPGVFSLVHQAWLIRETDKAYRVIQNYPGSDAKELENNLKNSMKGLDARMAELFKGLENIPLWREKIFPALVNSYGMLNMDRLVPLVCGMGFLLTQLDIAFTEHEKLLEEQAAARLPEKKGRKKNG